VYIRVTFVGVHHALERTGQGSVTGMATVVAPVVLLVTLVVRRVELLQSSSRPSG
jgi:hypothetical protein